MKSSFPKSSPGGSSSHSPWGQQRPPADLAKSGSGNCPRLQNCFAYMLHIFIARVKPIITRPICQVSPSVKPSEQLAPCGIVKDAPSSKRPASAIPVRETMAQNGFFQTVNSITSVPDPLQSLSKIPSHKTEQRCAACTSSNGPPWGLLGYEKLMSSPEILSCSTNSVGAVADEHRAFERHLDASVSVEALNNILGVSCFNLHATLSFHQKISKAMDSQR